MSAQEVSRAEPTNVVAVELTQGEAQFLLMRCALLRSVLYSNLQDADPNSKEYESLQQQSKELDVLMTKLEKAARHDA